MIATPARPMAEILVHAAAAAGVGGKVQNGETGHGDPDDREPYGVHGHYGTAQERETEEIPLRPALQKGVGESEGQGQEEEFGDQLVLGQTLDELASPRYARLAEVYEEEQGVQATGQQRRLLALEQDARQGVEDQECHDHQRGVQVGE